MRSRLSILFILLLITSYSFAKDLGEDEAQAIAEKCLPACAKTNKLVSKSLKLTFNSTGIRNQKDNIDKKSGDLLSALSDLNAKQTGTGIRLILNNSLLFSFDNSELRSSATDVLEKVLLVLSDEKLKDHKILIEGHTCWIGTDDYNLKLSQERAASVRKWFLDSGIRPNLISTIGHGETKPAESNETEEGRSKNRRVEILIEK